VTLDRNGGEIVVDATRSLSINLMYLAHEGIRHTAVGASMRAQNGWFMGEFSTNTDVSILPEAMA